MNTTNLRFRPRPVAIALLAAAVMAEVLLAPVWHASFAVRVAVWAAVGVALWSALR